MKYNILLVEDEQKIAEGIMDYMNGRGMDYETCFTWAADGDEAPEDRHITLCPDGPAYLKSICPRKHDVQQHQIVFVLIHKLQCLVSISRPGEACLVVHPFRILDIDDLHRVARRREVHRMQSCHGEGI